MTGERFWFAVEHRQLIRRGVLVIGVGFIGTVTWWSAWFASNAPPKYDAAGVGIIIAAVQGPCTMLFGHIVSLYNSARTKANGGGA
jgi:hypothetical protein